MNHHDATCTLKGFITEAELPLAEVLWPGLLDFLRHLPSQERPRTFLDLMWRFEGWRARS